MAKSDKSKKETIDFSGVPEDIRRGATHIAEGDYLGKVVKVEKRWKDDDRSNVPYFQWMIQVNEGPAKGSQIRFTTSLQPDALFNLRNLIFAATGKNVAGKKMAFDPQKLIGKVVGITVADNEYKDKQDKSRISSAIVGVMPKDEIEEGEEEEEEDEDEDVEEEEDEEEEEEDEELEEVDLDEI